MLAPLDLLFAAIASLAYSTFAATDSLASLSIAVHFTRLVFWLAALAALLRPAERWLRKPAPTDPAAGLRAAARAAYRAPLWFALLFALLWGLAYAGITVAAASRAPSILPAGLLFSGATALAAFPFAFLWAEYLATPVRTRLSRDAATAGALPPPNLSLRSRVLAVSLCLIAAPSLWLLSMTDAAALAAPGGAVSTAHLVALFSVAVLLWGPICGWLLVKTLATPIEHIAAAVERTCRDDELAGDALAENAPVPILYRDEIGTLAEATNRMRDRLVTELARREALAADNAQLLHTARRALSLRDEFLTYAGHELRTPLTSMTLSLALLENAPDAPVDRKRLAVVHRQTARLLSLVEGVFDTSEILADRFALERRQVDLVGLASDVVASFTDEAAQRGSPIQLHAPASALAQVDPKRVERALVGLLSNALKFGAGKPIDVAISNEANQVQLSVCDRGPGIPADLVEVVFERFDRGASELHHAGLGLGLFLARQIAEAHAGSLRFERRADKGAMFVLSLPVGEDAPAPG